MSESVEKLVSKRTKKKESKQEDVDFIVVDEIAKEVLLSEESEPLSEIKVEESLEEQNQTLESDNLNESLKARAMSHTHLKMKRALDEKPHKARKYYRVRSGH